MPDARLLAQILLHQGMHHAELRIERLASRQPPTLIDRSGTRRSEPSTSLGMTLSARLLRYLSHPEGYGDAFPWSRALWLLRVECRRRHQHHRGPDVPYWRGALCHQLVMFTVVRGYSIASTARILRYDRPEPVLRYALAYIESVIDQLMASGRELDRQGETERQARVSGHALSAQPHRERHDMPGLHRVECPQCRRRGVEEAAASA